MIEVVAPIVEGDYHMNVVVLFVMDVGGVNAGK